MTDQSNGYLPQAIALLTKVETEQLENIRAAAKLMAGAIQQDRLIHVYGGGGHTTLCVGEMFFRAGGLCNINPIMETGLSVFNQALKYLELERIENYGDAIMRYYKLQKDDVLIVFHNIGINPATIDAAAEAKKAGAKIIAVSSSLWQGNIPKDAPIRHSNGKNLFDYADVRIDDYNPVGDTIVKLEGFETPIAPISNIVDFYIAHRLEIETAKECLAMGVQPPMWKSANVEGGDAFNQKNIEKYTGRVKML
ncbi:MAG: sugar isomerase domain-containing protein [Clostridia bacterium]